jgi:hypothetical protein
MDVMRNIQKDEIVPHSDEGKTTAAETELEQKD